MCVCFPQDLACKSLKVRSYDQKLGIAASREQRRSASCGLFRPHGRRKQPNGHLGSSSGKIVGQPAESQGAGELGWKALSLGRSSGQELPVMSSPSGCLQTCPHGEGSLKQLPLCANDVIRSACLVTCFAVAPSSPSCTDSGGAEDSPVSEEEARGEARKTGKSQPRPLVPGTPWAHNGGGDGFEF